MWRICLLFQGIVGLQQLAIEQSPLLSIGFIWGMLIETIPQAWDCETEENFLLKTIPGKWQEKKW